MRVVFDTNVLVSALLKRDSVSAVSVDLARTGRVRPLFDGRMIAEYNEVLSRSRFGFVFGFAREFLNNFQAIGETILQPAPYLRPSACARKSLDRWNGYKEKLDVGLASLA